MANGQTSQRNVAYRMAEIAAGPIDVEWNYCKSDISGTSSQILTYTFRFTTATSSLSAGTIMKTVPLSYDTNSEALDARAGFVEVFLNKGSEE